MTKKEGFLFLFLNQGDKNLPNLFESNSVNKRMTTTNIPTYKPHKCANIS